MQRLHCPILLFHLHCSFLLHELSFPTTVLYSYCHLEKCSTKQDLSGFIPHKAWVGTGDSHILVLTWNRKLRQSPDTFFFFSFACGLFCFNLKNNKHQERASVFASELDCIEDFSLFFLDFCNSKEYPNASVDLMQLKIQTPDSKENCCGSLSYSCGC